MSQPESLPPPPQDANAEDYILGACMLSPKAVTACAEIVRPDDFYRHSNGVIYQTILDLYGEGSGVDAITVCDRLAKTGQLEPVGGLARVNELASIVPATSNAAHYARIVVDLAAARSLIRAGLEIRKIGQDRQGSAEELYDQAEQVMFGVSTGRQESDFVPLRDSLQAAFRRLEELHQRGAEVVGLPSGLRDLDRLTAGFQPGNLIVVAARPSMGKSALALGVCAHVTISEAVPACMFSLEMSTSEVTQRMLSMHSRVDSTKIRTGRLDRDEWKRIMASLAALENAPFHLDDSGALTVTEVRSKARRLKTREPNLGLVVVDYLQLMLSGKTFESRVQEVSQISRSLKALARELEVPVIAVSQLSRAPEQRHDKRPILSDLRESGAIEQDADLVVFLYRDEYYNPEDEANRGLAEAHLAKHRNGPTGVVKLTWVKRLATFSDPHLPGDTGAA